LQVRHDETSHEEQRLLLDFDDKKQSSLQLLASVDSGLKKRDKQNINIFFIKFPFYIFLVKKKTTDFCFFIF
jgi:hypothetical protein